MKIKNILFVTLISFITLFATISCSEYSVLNELLRTTDTLQTTAVTYSSNNLTEDDGTIEELALLEHSFEVIQLSDTPNELVQFNELRLEIIRLHDELLLQRESIQTTRGSIRNSVDQLKEQNYILLEDDKQTIQTSIEVLKSYRSDLIETKGLAYQRIYDLRGTYSRDNLANIIVVYQEVIEVLEYRLGLFENATLELQMMDELLLEYLGS